MRLPVRLSHQGAKCQLEARAGLSGLRTMVGEGVWGVWYRGLRAKTTNKKIAWLEQIQYALKPSW